ncbi:MAG: tetratricopeptide repeat protein [Bacteroidales bacterium]|nr:tetratricopeptide repeat protein [Bacteroidales bacterium]NLH23777.1 tetratricopeptide repeat protein [Bacteroidales bacterium]
MGSIQMYAQQQQVIDSLLRIIESTSSDSVRIYNMGEVAWLYINVKPQIALEYAHKGLKLSEKTSHKKGISVSLNCLGAAHTTIGNFDSALVYYERRLDLVEQMKDTLGIAAAIDNISVIHLYKRNYYTALKLREESNNIYKEAEKTLLLAHGYVWIGNIYLSQEKFDLALHYYLEAKRIFEKEKDSGAAYALVNIGTVYRRMKNYEQAIENLEKSKDLFEERGDLNGVGSALYRIATIYYDMKDREKYLETLFQAEEVLTNVGNEYFLSLVNSRLADEYKLVEDYEKALFYLNKTLAYGEKSGAQDATTIALHGMATVHYARKEYYTALDYLRKAEQAAVNLKVHLPQIFLDYVRVFGRLNEPDSVEKYAYAYESLNDSLISEKTIQAVADLQAKYDSEKKEKEIAILNLENENFEHELEKLNQKNQIDLLNYRQSQIENENYRQSLRLAEAERDKQRSEIEVLILNEEIHKQAIEHEKKTQRLMTLGFVIIFLALLVITYFISLWYRNKKKQEEAQLKQTAAELSRQLMETNMKALNFQLNPHFIFNCVQTVEYLLKESRTEESMAILRKFSNLTRLMLESMSKKEISLERELEIVQFYMDLENTRCNNSFTYSIDVDPSLDIEATMIPPLILQPFVENSIKHGFAGKDKGNQIKITIRPESNNLLCEITDNGVGFSAGRQAKAPTSGYKKESLGLKLIRDRLQVINKMHDASSSFTIVDLLTEDNKTKGTRVSLYLPNTSAA